MPTTIMTDDAIQIGGDEELSTGEVSILSIVGLLLGLAAPLCFLAPLLWAVPIAGVVVTLTALARVDSSGGALIGRKAALVGLALCVASVCAVASQSIVTHLLLSRQAREVTLEWISTLQAGNTQQAFELTTESTRPKPAPPAASHDHGSAHDHSHEGEHADDPVDQFQAHPVVRFLTTDGAGMKARFVRDLEVQIGSQGDARIQEEIAVRDEGGGQTERDVTLQVTLILSRSSATAPSRWYLSEFQSDDLPAATTTDR